MKQCSKAFEHSCLNGYLVTLLLYNLNIRDKNNSVSLPVVYSIEL